MCTLMEKDVLMEEVSGVAAFISERISVENIPYELKRCGAIREFLLSNSPDDIDKESILQELSILKEKFVDMPVILD